MAISREVLWLTNAQCTQILFVSEEFEEVWGQTCHSFYNAPNLWLDAVHPDEREGVRSKLESAARGETKSQQYRIVRSDGTVRLIRNNYFLMRDTEGGASSLVSVAEDITDRHQLEQQIFQAKKMEALGRLAGCVAHDFNNLLTVMVGYGDMVKAKLAADDPLRGAVEQIRKAGDRAASLTQQLLAFSRKQVLVPVVVDFNALVTELVNGLEGLLGANIDRHVALAPNLWKVKVDRGQMEQAITNIVKNAKDAMPRGGTLTIETANVNLPEPLADTPAGDYVLIAVSDSGSGMDEATRDRALEPYFTTKGPDHGTGLGLATAYGVVRQSGGRIDVCSDTGAGTAFKIYLPRFGCESERSSATAGGFGLRRGTETLLLVEDETDVRTLARLALQNMGYTVLEAMGGREALELCQRHKGAIHLLVTDLVMPNMSGRELASQIAALRPDTKALYLSGHPEETVVDRGMLEPGGPFLQKPFTATSLARKVREVLDGAREYSQPLR